MVVGPGEFQRGPLRQGTYLLWVSTQDTGSAQASVRLEVNPSFDQSASHNPRAASGAELRAEGKA